MKLLINKFSVAALSLALLLGSCSKSYLEKKPADSLPDADALSTVSGLSVALNGDYASLRTSSLFGRDLPVLGDVQGDNAFIQSKNSGRYLRQYAFTVTSSDAVYSDIWNSGYVSILRANRILETTLTGADVDKIKAEAYAIRALVYFKLVNVYGRPYTDNPDGLGVPLITKYDPYLYPPRNTVKEVYTQIVSDLTAAIANLSDYTSSTTISKYAAKALLARVYLYMGDNANAKATALDVINNSGFTLVTPASYQAFWNNPAARTDKVETLFEVDADGINNNGFDDLGGFYLDGYQDLYASSQLVGLYSATDIRKSVLLAGTTATGVAATLNAKYPNTNSADKDNIKVIRLSEVYLIAAEASLPANETDAKIYLNALVAKRDPAKIYISTGAALLNDIVTERRKELAFEGDRLFDLNRLKLPVNRVINPGSINAGTGNVNLNIPYADTRRVSPLPLGELTVNKNISTQQNPGY